MEKAGRDQNQGASAEPPFTAGLGSFFFFPLSLLVSLRRKKSSFTASVSCPPTLMETDGHKAEPLAQNCLFFFSSLLDVVYFLSLGISGTMPPLGWTQKSRLLHQRDDKCEKWLHRSCGMKWV